MQKKIFFNNNNNNTDLTYAGYHTVFTSIDIWNQTVISCIIQLLKSYNCLYIAISNQGYHHTAKPCWIWILVNIFILFLNKIMLPGKINLVEFYMFCFPMVYIYFFFIKLDNIYIYIRVFASKILFILIFMNSTLYLFL